MKEQSFEMCSKVKQIMEKQLELLSHESQGANTLTELAEVSQQMVVISTFLLKMSDIYFIN